jgi:GNAT superfamily N-acetyltransferase
MELSEIQFLEGPFEPAQFMAWSDAIKRQYPEHRRMADRAVALILDTLELDSRKVVMCLDGTNLVGFIRYVEPVIGEERIEIIGFAVLPSHQGKRIGARLLEEVQGKARGRVPIFASGVLEPAVVPLQRAGFWEVKKRFASNHAFKWSDLPKHQNDHTPGACEDEASTENETMR